MIGALSSHDKMCTRNTGLNCVLFSFALNYDMIYMDVTAYTTKMDYLTFFRLNHKEVTYMLKSQA